MTRRRGTCPVCRARFDVRTDGNMRVHRAPRAMRRSGELDCPGSGKPPRSDTDAANQTALGAFVAAEARGYRKAIEALRDTDRYDDWLRAQPFDEDLANDEPSRRQLADYLEATTKDGAE